MDTALEKKYTIGGKTFIQRKLVLGQWRQLLTVLPLVRIPEELTPRALVEALQNDLFVALAVVLTEEGTSLAGKDLPALASEIEWGIDPLDALEALADFFLLNPIPSLVNEGAAGMSRLIGVIKASVKEIGSKSSAISSPGGTSPSGNGSSGTLAPETPADGQESP